MLITLPIIVTDRSESADIITLCLNLVAAIFGFLVQAIFQYLTMLTSDLYVIVFSHRSYSVWKIIVQRILKLL